MKKGILVGVILSMFLSFTTSKLIEKTSDLGKVKKVHGKLIFVDCEPVMEYDVVAEVSKLAWSGIYNDFRDVIFKKIRRKHSDLPYDGLIFRVKHNGQQYVEMIKFK